MIPVFLGCETSEDVGIKYNLESGASVKFEEFALSAVNVHIDSLRTDSENEILVGIYDDEVLGEVSAEGYFSLSYNSGPLPREVGGGGDTLKRDSMVILLKANRFLTVSNLGQQSFDLYSLEDSLISRAIYLSELELSRETQIGSFSESINSSVDSIYQLSLTEDFQQEFYERISEIAGADDQFISTSTFKSLAISPGTSTEFLTEFNMADDTAKLYIYSSPVGSNDTTYLTTFRLSGKKFTNIDRSQSMVASLEDRDEVQLSELTIDPLYGITTKVSINTLMDFFNQNEKIIINNATISYEVGQDALREDLGSFYSFLYRENGYSAAGLVNNPFTNLVMSDDAILQGQSIPAVGFSNEAEDEILVNATLFFQTLYNDFQLAGELIVPNTASDVFIPFEDLLLISQNNVTLQKAVFPSDGIKLRLYYTQAE